MDRRFENKIALVTGAAMGIGKAVAQRLAKEGAMLALLDSNAGLLKKTTDDFREKGFIVESYITDISDEAQVIESVLQVEKQWGKIDILVHAAGIVGPTSTKITEYSTADFDLVYRVNLKGTFLITKHIIKLMEKAGFGRVLLFASIGGKEGNPGMVGYSSTKSAVIGLVKAVGKEYATTRITVNGIAPAVIETPMNADTSKEQLAYMVSKIPMQRLGTVEEVAAMCCFIVSDENSFSTGFIYDISGGRATY